MSILENVLHANLDDMWKPGRHTLIIAQPRSGKTSFLLYVTAVFLKLDELVVVRDIGEFFEWFSMLEHGYKIVGHVPKDCRILYEHPNFEQVEFDVNDLNTLFDHLKRGKVNLVFFESFCLNVANYVRFWSGFFRTLLPWKQQPGKGTIPLTLVCDEFGDLAPGKGRTYLPGQNQISQLIAMNHRKFRRHNIRLEAAVHYFRDITPPIRERFDCYCIKKNYPNPKEVPFTLQNYAQLFPKLEIDKMIFVDSAKNFNEFEIREEIKPKRYYNIAVEGNVDRLMRRASSKEERLSEQVSRAIKKLDALGLSTREIAETLNISQRAVQFRLYGRY